jgi:hypothetical protein
MIFAWWPHTTDRRTASYRLRCAQIISALRAEQVDCGEWKIGMPAPSVLVLSKRYDAATIKTATELRASYGTRLLLDLCDNHFYSNDTSPMWHRRADELRKAIKAVDGVVASTKALAQVIRNEVPEASNISIIGDAAELPTTPHDISMKRFIAEWQLRRLESFLTTRIPEKNRRLIWFGNHGSGYADGGMADLRSVERLIHEFSSTTPLHLTIISNNRDTYRRLTEDWKISSTYLPWRAQNFSRILKLHGTCIIPIRSNPFTICKTNNRVATALLHGLSVISDSIPSYQEFDKYITLDDWPTGLQNSTTSQSTLDSRIVAGANFVIRNYGIQQIKSQWHETLNRLRS